MRKITAAYYYTVGICAAIIIAFIAVINVIFAFEKNLYIYLLVMAFSFLALIILFRCGKIKERHFFYIFIPMAVLCRVALSLAIDACPVSDFSVMYNAARQAAMGDFSFQNNPYFFYWSYQTGFVLYQALIISVLGDSTTALLVMNGLTMAATNILIYCIIKNTTQNSRSAMFGAILYLLYPAQYLYVSVLTNQHLALFFILFGLFVITQQHIGYRNSIIGGALIAMGNIIRPIGIVVMIPVMIFFFVRLLEDTNLQRIRDRWKEYLGKLTRAVSFLVAYVLVGIVASTAVMVTGVNAQGLKNNDPYWKYVVGLHVETYGRYTRELVSAVSQAKTLEERHQIERDLIAASLSKIKADPVPFFYEKSTGMWANYENTSWAFGQKASVNREEATNVLWKSIAYEVVRIDKCYYLFLFLTALAGMIVAILKKKLTPPLCLIALTFCLYFGIHLVLEIQTRYRDFAMPFICIMASYGWLLLPADTYNGSMKLDTKIEKLNGMM